MPGSVVINAEVTIGKVNAEKCCKQNRSQRLGFYTRLITNKLSWRKDNFEIDYIQCRVETRNKKKLFNLAEFSNQNTAELIAVGDHHYVMGETTDKENFVIKVLSEEAKINQLVVNKTNIQNCHFYQFSLGLNSPETTYTVTTQGLKKF